MFKGKNEVLKIYVLQCVLLAMIGFTVACTPKVEEIDEASSDLEIPLTVGGCVTPNCASGVSGTPAYSAIFAVSCEQLMQGGANVHRFSQNTMTCENGACTSYFNVWFDENQQNTAWIAPGSYAVAVVFDHDSSFDWNNGPEAGDTVCCDDLTINADTESLPVSSCQDRQ